MASCASSPSKPANDDLKLDELVSELHALKKLYGLLQNNSAEPACPDQPTAQVLDKKSSHLLKKLLDGATYQVLQSQAKIISCTDETPKSQAAPNNPSNNDLQKEVAETEKSKECQPTAPPENFPEAAISTPVAQPKISQNQCTIPEPTRSKHRRSKDATVHRCRDDDDTAHLDRRLINRPSESGSRRETSQQSKNGSCRVQLIRSGGSERPPSSEKGGELLTLVPAQKRLRVEPADLPSRTNKPDRVDRELIHQKRSSSKHPGAEPSSMRTMQRTNSSKYQSSRSIIPVGVQMAQLVQKKDQLAESKTRVRSKKHIKPARLNRSKAKRFSSSSEESAQSISDSTCSTASNSLNMLKHNRTKTRNKIAPPQTSHPKVSPRPHPSSRSPTIPIVQKNDQSIEIKSRANRPIKPVGQNRSRAASSSTGSITRSASAQTSHPKVSNWSTRPAFLTPRKHGRVKTRGRRRSLPLTSSKPPIPDRSVARRRHSPPSRPARACLEPKQDKVDEHGRFKKLTDKLAIIFHHHHHHHHHLHAGEGDKGCGKGHNDHKRSIWKYLKGVLPVRKKCGEVQGKLHGYNLRVMMEWFFHHLWWMRQRRRKKVERRRLAKKVKWWEWFKRKRGVVVRSRRRNRLRLGFNDSHRRVAGGKGLNRKL